jgi:hypothetical protein
MNAAAAVRGGQPQGMGLTTFVFPGCTIHRLIFDAHVAAGSTLYVEIHTMELS